MTAVLLNGLISVWLHADAKNDLNIRSAYLHMLGDAVSALGVVVAGIIPLVSSAGTFVSQSVVSQTVVHQTWSTTQAAATWSIPANCAEIATFQGGGNAAAGGTF